MLNLRPQLDGEQNVSHQKSKGENQDLTFSSIFLTALLFRWDVRRTFHHAFFQEKGPRPFII